MAKILTRIFEKQHFENTGSVLDWSALNGIFVGIAVSGILFFVLPFHLKFYVWFFGGVACGCISRRNGWIVGSVFGLLIFCCWAYFAIEMDKEYGVKFHRMPGGGDFSLSQMLRPLMSIPPLSAAGGFAGSLIRRFFITQKTDGDQDL